MPQPPTPTPHDVRIAADVLEASAAAAQLISQPMAEPAGSFALHAPLELIARVGLAGRCHGEARMNAIRRIRWLGTEYARCHDDAGPSTVATVDDNADARELVDALAAGDLDAIERHWSVALTPPLHQLTGAIAPVMVPSLAAAGHAPIFLSLLRRVADTPDLRMVARSLLRELGRNSAWRLTWFDEAAPMSGTSTGSQPGEALAEALRTCERPGLLGSNFIYPTMSLVERSGVASRALSPLIDHLDVTTTKRVVSRVAALSMLQEGPDHAPYGWTHCLTMPHAVLDIAPWMDHQRVAVAVAATFSLGFRTTLANRELDLDWAPADSPAAVREWPTDPFMGTRDPDVLAATAWSAASDPATRNAIIQQLVEHAAVHHDAHLAKYTLTCLHAADDDPAFTHGYLASATKLHAIWAATEPTHWGPATD